MESCAGFVQMLRKKARKNALLILIMVGVILGFVIGILMNSHVQSSRYDDEERRKIVMLTSFLGDIFIRLLKLLIIPLIITSIVTAVASLDTKTTGKIGRRTFIYFFLTTFIAVIVGIILVVSIRPGDTAVQSGNEEATHVSDPLISILDLVRLDDLNSFFQQCMMYACKTLIKGTLSSTTVYRSFSRGALHR